MRMRVVSVESKEALHKVTKATRAALGIVAHNVLSDCKTYVPYDRGALQRSGTTRLTEGAAYVEWGGGDAAEYARIQYFGQYNHATTQNALHAPNACDHWYERCAGVRRTSWEKMFKQVIKEKTGGDQ